MQEEAQDRSAVLLSLQGLPCEGPVRINVATMLQRARENTYSDKEPPL